jgi:hypothetical protein
MGRPLNKRYFGDGAGNQIKVRAKVGSNSVADGYIISQRSTRRFKVNANGNVAVCKLVDKADGSLLANEMNITVLTDANTLSRVTKMYNRVAIVGGQKVKWNFSADMEDGAVQVPEESGDDLEAIEITIDTQPVNASVTAPAAATFTVEASVTVGNVSYQWQEETEEGWAILEDETSDTLTIDPTAVEDDGRVFRVVVSAPNATNVVSNEVTLSVAE